MGYEQGGGGAIMETGKVETWKGDEKEERGRGRGGEEKGGGGEGEAVA